MMDTRKRRKEGASSAAAPLIESLHSSPKRARVHAQRKFAQGSQPNSPVITPAKEFRELRERTVSTDSRTKPSSNGSAINASTLPADPALRPKTEDFLTFLCFRGTHMMPPELEFFETPQIVDVGPDSRSHSPCHETKPKQGIRKKCEDVKGITTLSKENIRKNLDQIEGENLSLSPPSTRVTRSSASLTPTPSFLSSPPSSDVSPQSDSSKQRLTRKQLLLKKAMLMKARTLRVRRRKSLQLRSKDHSEYSIVTRSGIQNVDESKKKVLVHKNALQSSRLTKQRKKQHLSRILKRLGLSTSPHIEKKVVRITRSRVESTDEHPTKEISLPSPPEEKVDPLINATEGKVVNISKEDSKSLTRESNNKETQDLLEEEKSESEERTPPRSCVLRRIRARKLNAVKTLLRDSRGSHRELPMRSRRERLVRTAAQKLIKDTRQKTPTIESRIMPRRTVAKDRGKEIPLKAEETLNKRRLRIKSNLNEILPETSSTEGTNVRSRPVRKTKQVAEVYLELISQKLAKESCKKATSDALCEEDDDDDAISISSIKELKSLAGNKTEIDMEKCMQEISQRHEKENISKMISPASIRLKNKLEKEAPLNSSATLAPDLSSDDEPLLTKKRELRSKNSVSLEIQVKQEICEDKAPQSISSASVGKNPNQEGLNSLPKNKENKSPSPTENDRDSSKGGLEEPQTHSNTSQNLKPLKIPQPRPDLTNSCKSLVRKPFRRKRSSSDAANVTNKKGTLRRHSHDLRQTALKPKGILSKLEVKQTASEELHAKSGSVCSTLPDIELENKQSLSPISKETTKLEQNLEQSSKKLADVQPRLGGLHSKSNSSLKSLKKISSRNKRTLSLDSTSKNHNSDIALLTRKFASMDCVADLQEKERSSNRPKSLPIHKKSFLPSDISNKVSDNESTAEVKALGSGIVKKGYFRRKSSNHDQNKLNEVLESVAKDFEMEMDETHYHKIENDLNSGNKSPDKASKPLVSALNKTPTSLPSRIPLSVDKIDVDKTLRDIKEENTADAYSTSPCPSPVAPASSSSVRKSNAGKKLCDVVRNLQERKQAQSPHSFKEAEAPPTFVQEIDARNAEKERQVSEEAAASQPLDLAPAPSIPCNHLCDAKQSSLTTKSPLHKLHNCTSGSSAQSDIVSPALNSTPEKAVPHQLDAALPTAPTTSNFEVSSSSSSFAKNKLDTLQSNGEASLENDVENGDNALDTSLGSASSEEPTSSCDMAQESSELPATGLPVNDCSEKDKSLLSVSTKPEVSKTVNSCPSVNSSASVSTTLITHPNSIVPTPLVCPIVPTSIINPVVPTPLIRPVSIFSTVMSTNVEIPTINKIDNSTVVNPAPVPVVNPILSVPVVNPPVLDHSGTKISSLTPVSPLRHPSKINVPVLSSQVARLGHGVSISPAAIQHPIHAEAKVSKPDQFTPRTPPKQILIAPKPSKSNNQISVMPCGSMKQVPKPIQIAPKLPMITSQSTTTGHLNQAAPILANSQVNHMMQGMPHHQVPSMQTIQAVQALPQVHSAAPNFQGIAGMPHSVQTVIPQSVGLGSTQLVTPPSPAKIITQPVFVSSSMSNIVPTPFDLAVHRPLQAPVGAVAQVVTPNIIGKGNGKPSASIMAQTSHPLVTLGPGNADSPVISSFVPIHPGQQQFLTVNMMPVGASQLPLQGANHVTSGAIGSIICPPTVTCMTTPVNSAPSVHAESANIIPPDVSGSNLTLQPTMVPISTVIPPPCQVLLPPASNYENSNLNPTIVSESLPPPSISEETSIPKPNVLLNCAKTLPINLNDKSKAAPKEIQTINSDIASHDYNSNINKDKKNTQTVAKLQICSCLTTASATVTISCRNSANQSDEIEDSDVCNTSSISPHQPAVTTVISQALSKLFSSTTLNAPVVCAQDSRFQEKNRVNSNINLHSTVCGTAVDNITYSKSHFVIPKSPDCCMAGQKAITKVSQSSPPYVLSTQAIETKFPQKKNTPEEGDKQEVDPKVKDLPSSSDSLENNKKLTDDVTQLRAKRDDVSDSSLKFASKSITLTPIKDKTPQLDSRKEAINVLPTKTFYSSSTNKRVPFPKFSSLRVETKIPPPAKDRSTLEDGSPSRKPKKILGPSNKGALSICSKAQDQNKVKVPDPIARKEPFTKKTLFKSKNREETKDSHAFSPINESSVYAFEPELETPLEMTSPFSKRMKNIHPPCRDTSQESHSLATEGQAKNAVKESNPLVALRKPLSRVPQVPEVLSITKPIGPSEGKMATPALSANVETISLDIKVETSKQTAKVNPPNSDNLIKKMQKEPHSLLAMSLGDEGLNQYIETFPISCMSKSKVRRVERVCGSKILSESKRALEKMQVKNVPQVQKSIQKNTPLSKTSIASTCLDQRDEICSTMTANPYSQPLVSPSTSINDPCTSPRPLTIDTEADPESLPSRESLVIDKKNASTIPPQIKQPEFPPYSKSDLTPSQSMENSLLMVSVPKNRIPSQLISASGKVCRNPSKFDPPAVKAILSSPPEEEVAPISKAAKSSETKLPSSFDSKPRGVQPVLVPSAKEKSKTRNPVAASGVSQDDKIKRTLATTSSPLTSPIARTKISSGQSTEMSSGVAYCRLAKSPSTEKENSNATVNARLISLAKDSSSIAISSLESESASQKARNKPKAISNSSKDDQSSGSSEKASVKSTSIAIQCDLDESASERFQEELRANESGTQTEGPSKFPLPPSASPFYYLPLAMATLGDRMPAQLVQQMLAKTQGYVGATEFGMILQQAAQLAQQYHKNIEQQVPASLPSSPAVKPAPTKSGSSSLQKPSKANTISTSASVPISCSPDSSTASPSCKMSEATTSSENVSCQKDSFSSDLLKLAMDDSQQEDATTDNMTDDESDSHMNLDIEARKLKSFNEIMDDSDKNCTKDEEEEEEPIAPKPKAISRTKRPKREEVVVVKRRSGRSSTLAATRATESDMQGAEELRRSRKAKRAAAALAKEEAWSSSSEAPLSPTMSPDFLRGWPPPRLTSPTPSQSSEGTTSSTPSQRSRVSGPHSRRHSPASSTDSRRPKAASSSSGSNQVFHSDPVIDPGHLNISENSSLVRAPSFFPSDEEFNEPLDYIEKIRPEAEQFGLCRIIPPSNFRPECRVNDDMRFTVYRQYIHRIMRRWGPNVRTLLAIKKCLSKQNIELSSNPLIGGIELDLVQLYNVVQHHGGLMKVIEKELWAKVADDLRIPKSAQDRLTKLDSLYCKYLLPYALLSEKERNELLADVDLMHDRNQANIGLSEQGKKAASVSSDSEEEEEEPLDFNIKGKTMALSSFYRAARNVASQWLPDPSGMEFDERYWDIVKEKTHHVCVNAASVDTSEHGYGFPSQKNSPNAKHPWNLKNLCQNPNSVLRSMGNIIGVSAPTLHVGMIFSTVCWYRDPHSLPWIEYLHTGASKIWYGVASSQEENFHKALKKLVPDFIKDSPVWLPSDTTMIPPENLIEEEVKVSRVVQEPGQFVVVFPGAFTSSVCSGYLVSESAFFARPQYLDRAIASFATLRECKEPSMFSLDRLVLSVASDSKASLESLSRAKALVQGIVQREKEEREAIKKLGLLSSERLPSPDSYRKRKSRYGEEEEESMCEICRQHLYVSLVHNSEDDTLYCLHHAASHLRENPNIVEHCKFMYTYTVPELTSALKQMNERIQQKSSKRAGLSSSGKKGRQLERLDSFSSTSSSNLQDVDHL